MRRYAVVLYWSVENQAVIAEAPELPGRMAHGDSHAEALKNVNEAIGYWIRRARELGRPVPEPKGRRATLAGPDGPSAPTEVASASGSSGRD